VDQFEVQFQTIAELPSVANRTNHSSRIPSDKGIRGNVPGNYRTRRDDRVLTYRYATDDGYTGCDPHVFLNHDGLSDGGGTALRRLKWMGRCDDAHIRPDHHIVRDVEAAKIIESAVLIPAFYRELSGCDRHAAFVIFSSYR
jgi:hypothetical protein